MVMKILYDERILDSFGDEISRVVRAAISKRIREDFHAIDGRDVATIAKVSL